MGAGVVSVGRKQYVVGLYWENSPSGRIAQAAKEAAKQSTSPVDFFVTRPGDDRGRVPQFGLAPRNPEFKAGLPSLAGTLAMQQPGSWIGAFRFREGTAVIILRDDLIVPDGDLFFLDEGEARDRLFSEMAIGGFQRVYAPETWGVPSADTMPVSLLLNDRAGIRLRTVVMSPKAKAGLLIGGSLLALMAGIGFYIQDQMAREEEALVAQMQALEEARRAASQLVPGINVEPTYPPPERKWEKEPQPLNVIEACRKALEDVPLAQAGWQIANLSCSTGGLVVNRSRAGGFTRVPDKNTISDSANMATQVVPLQGVEPRGPEDLVDPEVVTRRYLEQNWSGTIMRTLDDPPPPPPPNYQGTWAPPPAPWVKRSFTFSVPVLPWTLPVFLSDVPGVIVRNMTQAGENAPWTIEGEIYENRR